MLAWLSFWSEVQIVCMCSSRCHYHLKIQLKYRLVLHFLYWLAGLSCKRSHYTGVCFSCNSSVSMHQFNVSKLHALFEMCRVWIVDVFMHLFVYFYLYSGCDWQWLDWQRCVFISLCAWHSLRLINGSCSFNLWTCHTFSACVHMNWSTICCQN